MGEACAEDAGWQSRTPGDFGAGFRASGFTWCEALSLGVPKLPKLLRANLWSEASFSAVFVDSRVVPGPLSRNRVSISSARLPAEVWAPTWLSRTYRKHSYNGPEVDSMTLHGRSVR